jgi:negative regulator of flagellin synthesis FlgM
MSRTKTQKKESTEKLSSNVGAKGAQKVQWSPEAELLNEGVQAVKNSPDVRHDKVSALKAKIKNGQYKVDSEKVAEKMLEDSLSNDVLTRTSES